jgi:hypothetical protein
MLDLLARAIHPEAFGAPGLVSNTASSLGDSRGKR